MVVGYSEFFSLKIFENVLVCKKKKKPTAQLMNFHYSNESAVGSFTV